MCHKCLRGSGMEKTNLKNDQYLETSTPGPQFMLSFEQTQAAESQSIGKIVQAQITVQLVKQSIFIVKKGKMKG